MPAHHARTPHTHLDLVSRSSRRQGRLRNSCSSPQSLRSLEANLRLRPGGEGSCRPTPPVLVGIPQPRPRRERCQVRERKDHQVRAAPGAASTSRRRDADEAAFQHWLLRGGHGRTQPSGRQGLALCWPDRKTSALSHHQHRGT